MSVLRNMHLEVVNKTVPTHLGFTSALVMTGMRSIGMTSENVQVINYS